MVRPRCRCPNQNSVCRPSSILMPVPTSFYHSANPGVDLEEGYITFTSLPAGFVAKVGKFRSAFGKINTLHTHVLPWADRPLVTENLLGGDEGISDAGLSASRILPAPGGLFLEGYGTSDARGFRQAYSPPRSAAMSAPSAICALTRTSVTPQILTSAIRTRAATTTLAVPIKRSCTELTRRFAGLRCGARSTTIL